jgi:thiosulfate dehydrogenase
MIYPKTNNLMLLSAAVAALALTMPETCDAGGAATPSPPAWTVPDIDKLPDDASGKLVRHGRDLVSKTSSLIGPEVADAEKRFAGNNLDCQSCHISAGTQKFALPLVGVYTNFPAYAARIGRVETIDERVQNCMERSMNGKPLPPDGPEMTALVAYLKFLSTGHPAGGAIDGRGSGQMPELDRAADPGKGQKVYATTCAACHGNNGEGQRNGKAGDAKGYMFPPLWGADSFNDGAGMHRLIESANFVHSNMPAGTTWNEPALSPSDAWDVAAYMNAQPRPKLPDLSRDYPDKLEKPVDAPYGPYADGFSIEQHKLGPFAPIKAAVAALKSKARR